MSSPLQNSASIHSISSFFYNILYFMLKYKHKDTNQLVFERICGIMLEKTSKIEYSKF